MLGIRLVYCSSRVKEPRVQSFINPKEKFWKPKSITSAISFKYLYFISNSSKCWKAQLFILCATILIDLALFWNLFVKGIQYKALKNVKTTFFPSYFLNDCVFHKIMTFWAKKFNDFLPNIKTMTMNNNEYSWDTKGFQTWQHGFTVRNKKKSNVCWVMYR